MNVPCIFPFKFSSVTEGIKTHYNCIVDQNDDERRNWCSTKVDDLGFHKSGEGNWGYCKSNCKGITNLKTKNDTIRNRTHQLQPSTNLTSKKEDLKSGKQNVLLKKYSLYHIIYHFDYL